MTVIGLKNRIGRAVTTARRDVTTWYPRFREAWADENRNADAAKARYVETLRDVAERRPDILGPMQRRTLARANRSTR
jgi:hypothetical protein